MKQRLDLGTRGAGGNQKRAKGSKSVPYWGFMVNALELRSVHLLVQQEGTTLEAYGKHLLQMTIIAKCNNTNVATTIVLCLW